VRKLLIIVLILPLAFTLQAQQENCILKTPQVTIHFGADGPVSQNNNSVPSRYGRVDGYCPTDGHYVYTPYTSRCFRDDWQTLEEDHTAGDVNGNMLLINSSPYSGAFFRTTINGLKAGTKYEFSTWMMNVCRITEKCPFPLLPDITIQLQTLTGKTIAQLSTGEVERVESPRWTQYNFMFTTPASETSLEIIMVNHNPGGCGNDFAMDDITFRECVPPPPPARKAAAAKKPIAKKTVAPPAAKKPPVKKPAATTPKKTVSKPPVKLPAKRPVIPVTKDTLAIAPPEVRKKPVLPPPPRVLTARANTLVRRIKIDAGNIKVDLFDNGEIDDDTVTIYHNNRLLVSKARLSQKPVTLNIKVNKDQAYHELVMVAENLGSIPPNTSLMIVTAGATRHEVFISSSKQKNAKVVLELKE
jgi:hypothetical protein